MCSSSSSSSSSSVMYTCVCIPICACDVCVGGVRVGGVLHVCMCGV